MSNGLDANQITHFAFGPTGSGNHFGDSVDLGIGGRQFGEHGAKYVIIIEGEVVRDEKITREAPGVRGESGHVASVHFRENLLAKIRKGGPVREKNKGV